MEKKASVGGGSVRRSRINSSGRGVALDYRSDFWLRNGIQECLPRSPGESAWVLRTQSTPGESTTKAISAWNRRRRPSLTSMLFAPPRRRP